MSVRSFLLSSYVQFCVTFGAEGTGFDTCCLPFFKLCFIRRCYDKEEFDTDCSYGCLKRFNRIVQETCSVLTYDNSLSIRNCL